MKKLFIIFAVLCLAAPAMAADWNFYGSARMATWYSTYDDAVAGTDDVSNTQWDQQGNSRIGAKVKVNDQIGGRFEMSDGFGKRLLYGTYNFGGGELLLGQSYTPITSFYSNSVYDGDGDLLNIGQFYEGRQEMIQLKFGGFKVAFVEPSTANAPAGTTTEVTIPKLEASYKFKTDMFFVDVFGGYNTFEAKGHATAGDVDVDSYVVGGGGGVNFGPAFIKAGVHMGENLGNFASLWEREEGAVAPKSVNVTGTTVTDNKAFGYLAVVGVKAYDMFTIEGGYGYQEWDTDLAGSEANDIAQYYLNATINIAPGFFIVPEVGFIDYGKNNANVDEGDKTYFGAKWQINF